ncbi:hypothetical protein ACFO3I_07675 [Rheinheimera marina]|uniref:Uncharacterized protein n=1 Tax=Rheinheimera marina TaxID=1774958 RepID=A0ABV9JKX4_9GAMM
MNNTTSSDKAVHLLAGLYQQAGQLYASAEVSASQVQQLSAALLALSQTHPALLLSQLSLTPKEQPLLALAALKQSALLCLLQRQLKLPDNWCLLMLQAVLVQPLALADSSAEFSAAQQRYPALLSLKTFPELCKALNLAAVFKLCDHKAKNRPYWQSSSTSLMVSFCWQVARLMLPGSGRFPGLEQISALFLPQADQAEFVLWQAISQDPLWLTGRFVQDEEQQLLMLIDPVAQQGMLRLVCFDKQHKVFSAITELPEYGLTLLQPRTFNDWAYCSFWQESEVQLATPDKLPNLHWLQQLASAQTVSQQSKMLQQQPELSELVKQQASVLSRQQLELDSEKHAIALIGQHNLPAVLQQSWLAQHCLLQAHPWHQQLLQFRQALQQALLLLDNSLDLLGLNSFTASTLAWCCCWPLWQQNDARLYPLVSAQGRGYLELYLKQQLWKQPQYQQLLCKVLSHLQCPPDWTVAAKQYRALPQQAQISAQALLLAAALELTLSLFSVAQDQAEQLEQSLRFLQQTSKKPLSAAAEYQQQLLVSVQPCTELSPLCNLISALGNESRQNPQISRQITA